MRKHLIHVQAHSQRTQRLQKWAVSKLISLVDLNLEKIEVCYESRITEDMY